MSTSEEERPTKRIKLEIEEKNDLYVKLKWNLRDQLIQTINKCSACLYSKSSQSNKTKYEIINNIKHLISELFNLNLKSKTGKQEDDLRWSKILETGDGDQVVQETIDCLPNLPSFEMSLCFRSQIVENLSINQHSAIVYNDQVEIDKKRVLIKQNDAIVKSLIDLPLLEEIQFIDNKDRRANETCKNETNDQVIKSERSADEEIEFRISHLKEEIIQLITSRSDVFHSIRITNAKQFLISSEKRSSEIFFCRSIPWYIAVQNKSQTEIDSKSSLVVYVHCDYEPKTLNWRCNTKIILKIISNRSDVYETTSKFDFEFSKRHGVGIMFITHDELLNAKKHYIGKNDSFVIQVNLICDKPTGA